MADRNEEEFPPGSNDSLPKDKMDRPVSGKSGGSLKSKKSIPAAVSHLTTKALREFRLSDEGTVSDFGEGTTLNSAAVGVSMDENEPTEGQTLPEHSEEYEVGEDEDEEEVDFGTNVDAENDEDLAGSDEDSDGENDLVVLDPDHVR